MHIEKYLVITSFVQYEQKTTSTQSPVFDTALEALLYVKAGKANTKDSQAERSYQFYELCVWVSIDSIKLFGKSEEDMQTLARKEALELFPVINPDPIV